jgi:hypothetical protein
MLLKIVLATALIAVGLGFVKDGRVLAGAGIVAKCSAVGAEAADGAVWQACRPGKLEGRPDLTKKSCVSSGVREGLEYWKCPAPVKARMVSG